MRKGAPEDRQNRYQNISKINAKIGIEQLIEIIDNYVSLMDKNTQTHCTNNFFKVLQVACVKGKVQKTFKNETNLLPQIDQKSMRKGCLKKLCQNNGKRCEHRVQKRANI